MDVRSERRYYMRPARNARKERRHTLVIEYFPPMPRETPSLVLLVPESLPLPDACGLTVVSELLPLPNAGGEATT